MPTKQEHEAALRKMLQDRRGKLPNGAKPCSSDEFWEYWSCYDFEAQVWHGNMKLDDGRSATVRVMYIAHGKRAGGGFAVAYLYGSSAANLDRVRYFTWYDKCEHGDWQQKNIGNCLNRYTCGKCGHFYDIDSSD